MIKKVLLTAAISLAFLSGYASPAEGSDVQQPATEVVDEKANGQLDVDNPEWPNSTEVSTVEESAVAHKMTQAEKAKNAAENDSWGGAITIIAMTIVLAALIVLSLLFFFFGKICASLMGRKKLEAHGITKDEKADDHEDVDSGEVIAAIALAISEHLDQRHDIEDTILTIRRMRKAYSPWNSKIYNMRQTPALRRNIPKGR